MDTAINRANERLNFVSQDQDFIRLYEMREKVTFDQTAILNTSLEKQAIRFAEKLISRNIPIEEIAEDTG